MASICTTNFHFLCKKRNFFTNSSHSQSCHNHQLLLSSPFSLSFSRCKLCYCAAALKTTGSESGGIRSDNAELLRRKPVISSTNDEVVVKEEEQEEEESDENGKKSEDWVDWEDQILEDTVPLVGFVRMILHSGKYAVGDPLSPEHQRTILQRLLPYHPECEKKIGSGVNYITVGYHPDFESSRCLFIVRKDGELVDFSYWKCIKGLIRKNYPLYADSFILRHFRRRRRND